ncbi:MAG: DUF475 domain-containing protein [Bdellovibrionales bacterium]
MASFLHYFKFSFVFSFIGLGLGAFVGWEYTGTLSGAGSAMFLTGLLAILEVSLSFDNAVVNASVLKNMTPEWQHRFLTWGILIAVFGMRLVFPLVIVCSVAGLDPWSALVLAATKPDQYAEIMLNAHLSIAGFGGSFLLMVALSYFLDHSKEEHWLDWIERPLRAIGKIEAVSIGVALLTIVGLSQLLESFPERVSFLEASMSGLITYVVVDGISTFLKMPGTSGVDMARASIGMFLYLEVLDASFSFDGVVGAFALTNNLFIIGIGLGIGALFVRSLTILLVEKGTLNQFVYLEHGAFYAIGALAAMMLLNVFFHIPEMVTGLIGATFIALAIWSSILHNRRKKGIS